MIPFFEAVGEWGAATFFPALLGLTIAYFAGRRAGAPLMAAFGTGIFLWFFVDSVEGTADFKVVSGYAGGVTQVAEVLLFVVGVVVFFSLGPKLSGQGRGSSLPGFGVVLLAALSLGIHGFGEGSAFGTTAYLTSSNDVLQAFGGLPAGAAYVLHKVLEPMIVGAIYTAYRSGTQGVKFSELGTLALAFSLPSIAGAGLGYFIDYDSAYGFALGSGAAVFALVWVTQVWTAGAAQGPPKASVSLAVAMALGFILIYGAALLHY